jgi:hypothetical protein
VNDLIRFLLDALDDFTSGDPADDRVDYDRLELAQEVAQALWDAGYRKVEETK